MDGGLEIFFFPVGEGSKTGDAIVLRYGNLHGQRHEQTVVVVDGGYSASGEAVVAHVKDVFGTDQVDIVIATHPDQDHVNGLKVVIEQLKVDVLLMHLPWETSEVVAESKSMGFKSPRVDDKFEANFAAASDLADMARARDIPIQEPFAGMSTNDGVLTVLSPTREFFEQLMGEVADSEKSVAAAALSNILHKMGEAVQKLIPESLLDETLTNAGDTSPQNNSSVITLIQIGGHAVLLTGDAGIPALEIAATQLESLGLVPGKLNFIQVPHHGSRRNVGPDILDRLLGPKGVEVKVGTAFVSAARDSVKHPAKKVLNAFRRRGYPVHGTADGLWRRYPHNAPPMPNSSNSEPYPFHWQVEEDDS